MVVVDRGLQTTNQPQMSSRQHVDPSTNKSYCDSSLKVIIVQLVLVSTSIFLIVGIECVKTCLCSTDIDLFRVGKYLQFYLFVSD